MLSKVSELLGIDTPKQKKSENIQNQELELVTAALLVSVSLADHKLSDDEEKNILSCLKEHFHQDEKTAEQILENAKERQNEALDLHGFTRVIMREMEQEGQQEIVRLLWRVAFADNELDHYENHIISKISDLLGVSIRDRVRLKQEVQKSLGLEIHS